jgi:hypothetical protein
MIKITVASLKARYGSRLILPFYSLSFFSQHSMDNKDILLAIFLPKTIKGKTE